MSDVQPMPAAAETPLIYTRRHGPVPLSLAERASALLVGVGSLAVMLTAAWLTPSPDGTGTHRELGLAACSFKDRTGLPCPSCGYTTAFSYFAHGNWVASAYTQPMGFVLALITAMAVWVGLYVAFTGRPVHRLFARVPSRYYVIPLLALALAAWGYKIVLTLTGHDGWHGWLH